MIINERLNYWVTAWLDAHEYSARLEMAQIFKR